MNVVGKWKFWTSIIWCHTDISGSGWNWKNTVKRNLHWAVDLWTQNVHLPSKSLLEIDFFCYSLNNVLSSAARKFKEDNQLWRKRWFYIPWYRCVSIYYFLNWEYLVPCIDHCQVRMLKMPHRRHDENYLTWQSGAESSAVFQRI